MKVWTVMLAVLAVLYGSTYYTLIAVGSLKYDSHISFNGQVAHYHQQTYCAIQHELGRRATEVVFAPCLSLSRSVTALSMEPLIQVLADEGYTSGSLWGVARLDHMGWSGMVHIDPDVEVEFRFVVVDDAMQDVFLTDDSDER